MLFKSFVLFITTFILGFVFAKNAVDMNPTSHKESFNVLDHRSMTLEEQMEIIHHAEEARWRYGTNLTRLSEHVYLYFVRLYGDDGNCFANIGEIHGVFWTNPYFIYLKSNTSDDMHIVCYKARHRECSSVQYKIFL